MNESSPCQAPPGHWGEDAMSEGEWFSCSDPAAMLKLLRESGRGSERKLRLFSVACCRCLPFSKDERFDAALEAAEQFADGQISNAALKRARQAIREARHGMPANDANRHGEWSVYWLAEVAASENAFDGVADEVRRLATHGILDCPPKTRHLMCSLIRCIFGNSFGPTPHIDRASITGTVLRLAQAACDERGLDGTLNLHRLAELADALEQVGCRDEAMLGHLRQQEAAHVRGCWVMDLLLIKA